MVKEGNYVVIKTKKEDLQGLLLSSQNSEKYLIKLNSGYNMSINKKNVLSIKKLDIKKEVKKEKSEIKKNPKLKNILILDQFL